MNQVSKRQALEPAQVRATIVKLVPEFTRALPPGVDPQRFARVVQTAIQQNDKLLECSPESLWGACMKAAQDGLMPDGREGAMVPRWNSKKGTSEAHWMPMVAGLIAKAKRKGSVASLSAQVVYEGEQFQVLLGDEDRIHHVRDITKVKRGKEIAVYAIATMKDGSKEREIMTWEQVQQVAAVSADKKTGEVSDVWKLWDSEMARKSCIRRLSKRLPSLDDGDDDFKRAVERVDELYDFGKPAVAAPETRTAIAHEHTVPHEIEREREPAPMNRMSSADLDAATDNDTIPALDPEPERPKPTLLETGIAMPNQPADEAAIYASKLVRKFRECQVIEDYNEIVGNRTVEKNLASMAEKRPELWTQVDAARQAALRGLVGQPDDAYAEQADA